jgi:hypothetical protein
LAHVPLVAVAQRAGQVTATATAAISRPFVWLIVLLLLAGQDR